MSGPRFVDQYRSPRLLRVLTVMALSLFAVLVGAAGAMPAQAAGQSDSVRSLAVQLDVRPDGSMQVTETEVHQFPEALSRYHGITRNIVIGQRVAGDPSHYRRYAISNLKVTSPSGAPVQVQRSETEAAVALRIGDPDKTVKGEQTYVISYTLSHVLNEVTGEGGQQVAELFWNVLSTANPQSIAKTTVRITGPDAALRSACVFGPAGSRSPCTNDGSGTFTVPALSPGDGVSASAQFPRSAFSSLAPDLVVDTRGITALTLAGGGLALPLGAAGLLTLLVRRRGRDEIYQGLTPGLSPGSTDVARVTRGKVTSGPVQFEPPRGAHPGVIGTVIDEKADLTDVSASIVDLAVRGFLTMTETKSAFRGKDWVLNRNRDADQSSLSPFEITLLQELFSTHYGSEGVDSVKLQDLRDRMGFSSATRGALYEEVVTRGWFRRRPDRVREGAVIPGVVLIGIAAMIAFFGSVMAPLNGDLFTLGTVPLKGIHVLAAGIALTGIMVAVSAKFMPYRTAEGSAVLSQSLGFKRYLVTAEANQIKFEEAQSLFSRYLPYAIVFGVESEWARTFEQVAARAAEQGMALTPPIWYIGNGGGSAGGFGELASTSSDFVSQASRDFAAASVTSSGGSGWSGGGGFSGGVGGGGGGSFGGSW